MNILVSENQKLTFINNIITNNNFKKRIKNFKIKFLTNFYLLHKNWIFLLIYSIKCEFYTLRTELSLFHKYF